MTESDPVSPESVQEREKMICDAVHSETGAICELPKGHTQNHRGAFDNGIAQWPDGFKTSLEVQLAAADADRVTREAEKERLQKRASTLEDAAFHFQTCRTCRKVGEEECESGTRFAAFLRGEEA
jgi:hypothetical protein